MTLTDEITALRDEIATRIHGGANGEADAPPPAPSAGSDAAPLEGVDNLIAIAKDAIAELGNEVDRYPRVTAMTAFGVGFALGLALRQATRAG